MNFIFKFIKSYKLYQYVYSDPLKELVSVFMPYLGISSSQINSFAMVTLRLLAISKEFFRSLVLNSLGKTNFCSKSE